MIEKYCCTPNDRLKLMRITCKCSQHQFSKIFGVSRATYNRIEKSGNHIDINYLYKLNKFGLNPGFILGNTDLLIGKNNNIDSTRKQIISHIKNLENS